MLCENSRKCGRSLFDTWYSRNSCDLDFVIRGGTIKDIIGKTVFQTFDRKGKCY